MICEIQHVRMRIPEVDAAERLRLESVAAEALGEVARRLVAEGFAEGEAEA